MDRSELVRFGSREEGFGVLQEAIAGAQDQVMLAAPVEVLDTVESALRDAVERDATVLLFLGNTTGEDVDFEGMATVARAWATDDPFTHLCKVDADVGILLAPNRQWAGGDLGHGVAFENEFLASLVHSMAFGNTWPMGRDVHVADPVDLPHTLDAFIPGVIQTTLHMRAGTPLEVTATGWLRRDQNDPSELSGQVTNVRQNFVAPWTNSFPTEHTITVDTGDDLVRVGGPKAFLEDFAATELRLERGD
ncbi:MAG: TrmB family transcriptional regulator sugar-binding domain-containing protein [Haloarculaceae archaeon]